jgi:hypothetical protein
MFAKIENNQVAEYPLTEGAIKMRFSNTSFPTNVVAALPEGYVRVQPSSQPSEDEMKVVAEGTPALIDGVWTQTWVQSDKYTADELVAYSAKKEVDKQQEERNVRTSLLAKSDWTQLADSPVDKAAWAIYRQALRNVPTQSGFPWTIVWPETP